MIRESRPTQFWCWAALIAMTALSCGGCAFATPMRAPTHNSGAAGEGANGKVSLGFIQAGKTSREEVMQKLGWTSTELKDDRLFLGRWASSSWGVYSMASLDTTNPVEDWNRHWGTHNVLIEFDEKGLVRKYRMFPDSEMIKELTAVVAESPGRSLDLAKPVEVPVGLRGPRDAYYAGSLVLAGDSFEFRQDNPNGTHNFKISPQQIQKFGVTNLSHSRWSHTLGSRQGPYPRYLNAIIHFTEKNKTDRAITLRVDPPVVLLLVEYLAETRSK